MGSRCATATIIKNLGLKHESYPFDWMVSKLPTIQHCIQTDFAEFLNPTNYVMSTCDTTQKCDNEVKVLNTEQVLINKYYQKDLVINTTYHFELAMNHKNILNTDDRNYYYRCIDRLYKQLNSNEKKLLLHISIIIGINEYNATRDSIIKEMIEFNTYISQNFAHTFGLFFVLVKHTSASSEKIYSDATVDIYKIETNPDFLDGWTPFGGDSDKETAIITNIVKSYL